MKETKRDGKGVGRLSTVIVPERAANSELRRAEGGKGGVGKVEPLMGNTKDAMESGNVYTKQQRIAELANFQAQCVRQSGLFTVRRIANPFFRRTVCVNCARTGPRGLGQVTAHSTRTL